MGRFISAELGVHEVQPTVFLQMSMYVKSQQSVPHVPKLVNVLSAAAERI